MIRFRWTYELEQELLQFVEGSENSISHCCEAFAISLGISAGSVMQKYYKLKNNEHPKRIPGLHVDVDDMITQLGKLKSLQTLTGDLRDTIQRKDETISRLESRIEELEDYEREYKKLLNALDSHRRERTVFKVDQNGNLERMDH